MGDARVCDRRKQGRRQMDSTGSQSDQGAMENCQDSVPSLTEGITVLDVKPLRCLTPMFPAPFGYNMSSSASNARPFVCITPFGSNEPHSGKPSGFPPAFPSFDPVEGVGMHGNACYANGSMDSLVTPLQKQPPTIVHQDADEEMPNKSATRSGRQKRNIGSSDAEGSKKMKKKQLPRKKHSKAQDLFFVPSTSDNPREPVEVILLAYDALRRRLMQIDETNNSSKKSHLKAMSIMMDNNLRINVTKTIGPVPGLIVGDIFYFRIEMCLVGLHTPGMAGIDYMNTNINSENDTLAVSIVSSGGYDNVANDVDVLVYSGQGGIKPNEGKTQVNDQKLEKGNLALERSLHRSNQIRVIRGTKDLSAQTGKIYIYDGLYKIDESWVEKGKSGFNVFKYKLLREPGQPDGFSIWKSVEKWKETPSSRGGIVQYDISSHEESFPVIVVNEVDDDKGPCPFSYSTRVKYSKPFNSTEVLQGCACRNGCLPGDSGCHCTQRNGGDIPYISTGVLVRNKPMIYECSSLCQCAPTCQNRITQKATRLHFEVFKTTDRGWGLRSWDPIRAGTFICEYTGELVDCNAYDDEHDDYIFETKSRDKTFKWNYGPELIGEPSYDESWESFKISAFKITARSMGNVSRFMNHSCSPNVFWQLVQHEHGDEGYPHVMFFAIKHIPPLLELTYDYGQGGRRTSHCLCGSVNCQGIFG